MTPTHQPSRGPSELEIALDRLTRAKIQAREADDKLGRAIDELHAAEAQVAILEDGLYSKEFTNARRMRAGAALWDRDPIEPAPQSLRAVR
jgi:hypothetical protein